MQVYIRYSRCDGKRKAFMIFLDYTRASIERWMLLQKNDYEKKFTQNDGQLAYTYVTSSAALSCHIKNRYSNTFGLTYR